MLAGGLDSGGGGGGGRRQVDGKGLADWNKGMHNTPICEHLKAPAPPLVEY